MPGLASPVPLLLPAQQAVLEFLRGGRNQARTADVARVTGAGPVTLIALAARGLIEPRTAGGLGEILHLTPEGRRIALAAANPELAHEFITVALPSRPGITSNPKENTMSTTATEKTNAPAATPENPMQGLYDALLDQIKSEALEITEKAAYARIRANGKTVVYVNHPSSKAVRLEFPKKGESGYEVVKVEDRKGVASAFKRIQKDAAAVAAK